MKQFAKFPPDTKWYRCPSCGLKEGLSEATRETWHEDPACAEYHECMNQFAEAPAEPVFFNPLSGKAEPGDKA